MVIIVRNGFAEMFYTTSQWVDAEDMMHGGGTGYTVPNSAQNEYNILGTPESVDSVTGEIIEPEIPPMTEAQVLAIPGAAPGFPIPE